jgi:hypothetical protein
MEKITFEDAVGHFSRNSGHWEAFIQGITEIREGKFRDTRACMEFPDTAQHQYWVRTGEMMGIDDLLYKLNSQASEEEFKDLQPQSSGPSSD